MINLVQIVANLIQRRNKIFSIKYNIIIIIKNLLYYYDKGKTYT